MQDRPFVAEFPRNWLIDTEKRSRPFPHFLPPANPTHCDFLRATQSRSTSPTAVSHRVRRRRRNRRDQGTCPCPVCFPDGFRDPTCSYLYSNGENPQEGEEHPPVEAPAPHELTTNDLFIKDAFLVFRALCKLTMKPVTTERCAYSHLTSRRFYITVLFSERDLKSHAMRSKLLSLHLVLTILNTHMPLIVSPHTIIYSSSNNDATSFVQAINQYLCLCLSRNAVSPVPQVFELSVEIFWRVLSGLRTKLKVCSCVIRVFFSMN
jgi:hypothetical protein